MTTTVATDCAQCGGPLDDSPSAYFCRQMCLERWHAARSDELEIEEL